MKNFNKEQRLLLAEGLLGFSKSRLSHFQEYLEAGSQKLSSDLFAIGSNPETIFLTLGSVQPDDIKEKIELFFKLIGEEYLIIINSNPENMCKVFELSVSRFTSLEDEYSGCQDKNIHIYLNGEFEKLTSMLKDRKNMIVEEVIDYIKSEYEGEINSIIERSLVSFDIAEMTNEVRSVVDEFLESIETRIIGDAKAIGLSVTNKLLNFILTKRDVFREEVANDKRVISLQKVEGSSSSFEIIYIKENDALIIVNDGKVIMYEEGISSSETLLAFGVDKVEELKTLTIERIIRDVEVHYEAVLKHGLFSQDFIDNLLLTGRKILDALSSEVLIFKK